SAPALLTPCAAAYISATDFFEVLFPGRHTDRLFTVAYLPSCLLLLLVTLRWRSARWLPRPPARIKLAYLLFTLLMLAVPLVDWLLDRSSSTPAPPTSALPGMPPLPHQPPAPAQYPDTPHPAPTPSRDTLRLPSPLAPPPHTPLAAPGGVLAGLLGSVLLLGVGDGLAQGAVFGEAAQLPPSFTQAVVGGTACSGLLVTLLRVITKAATERPLAATPSSPSPPTAAELQLQAGQRLLLLRHSSAAYFLLAALLSLACLAVYCLLLPALPALQRLRAPEGGQSSSLGDWYPILLFTAFNTADLAGKLAPLTAPSSATPHLLLAAAGLRAVVAPAAFLAATWTAAPPLVVTALTLLLGVTNGWLTAAAMTHGPQLLRTTGLAERAPWNSARVPGSEMVGRRRPAAGGTAPADCSLASSHTKAAHGSPAHSRIGPPAMLLKRSIQARAGADPVQVTSAAPSRAFLFGIGYTSIGLGNMLEKQGWQVMGTCRSDTSPRELQALKPSWQVLPFDPCTKPGFISDEVLEALCGSSHVLTSIPPLALPLYDPALRTQLAALKAAGLLMGPQSPLQWLGYLSSTGVYGDHGGDWVAEHSPCLSRSSRGQIRLQHEMAWAAAAMKQRLPLHIFRLGGIYGPGRSVLSSLGGGEGPVHAPRVAGAEEEQGSRPSSTGGAQGGPEGGGEGGVAVSTSKARRARQRYTSRCHVWDICQTLQASMVRPRPAAELAQPASLFADLPQVHQQAAVYNIVDDEPAPRTEVMAFARSLVLSDGARCNPTSSDASSKTKQKGPGAAEGAGDVLEEKRVHNHKVKEELGVSLRYPTYREGVAALAAGDIEPLMESDLRWLRLS
ncbi:hypothetical protein QJQ45_028297, partial [Haematococcus lacustris]